MQGKARQGKARQGKTRQGKARQGKARQGKARQGKARQGKARQGKARQGKARQGKYLYCPRFASCLLLLPFTRPSLTIEHYWQGPDRIHCACWFTVCFHNLVTYAQRLQDLYSACLML
jgi:hypothetical protein